MFPSNYLSHSIISFRLSGPNRPPRNKGVRWPAAELSKGKKEQYLRPYSYFKKFTLCLICIDCIVNVEAILPQFNCPSLDVKLILNRVFVAHNIDS